MRLEFVDASRTAAHSITETERLSARTNRNVPVAYTQRTAKLIYIDYNQHAITGVASKMIRIAAEYLNE